MPFNGSGTFNLIYNWQNDAAQGLNISSSRMQGQDADMAAGLSLCITKDGQQTATANLPMGGFRHTNVANAQNRTDYAAAGQVQDGTMQWLTSVAGTDTITGTLAVPSLTAYPVGIPLRFIPAGANTTSTVTLNVNAIGAKPVTKNGTVPLAPGDLNGAAVVIYDGTQFQLVSVPGTLTSTGTYSVRGLSGANNAGTPNTKYDVAADAVTLRGVGGRPPFTAFGTGALTNDVSLAGPIANGRDQSAAFGGPGWLYLYYIWNGATLATLSSSVAPAAGPVLPTGYTHWAYIGALFYSGSALVGTRIRGCYATYENERVALTNGTATSETSINLSSLIPPNAVSYGITMRQSPTGSASGFCSINTVLRIVTGLNLTQFPYLGYNGSVSSPLGLGISWPMSDAPNIGQSLIYLLVNTTGTGSLTMTVTGYSMPNGGE